MAPFADIHSVTDFNDTTSSLYSEEKSCPLHHESPLRKVSFSTIVAEYDIENVSDYSDEEREAAWYSTPQLREFKRIVKLAAHQMETGQLDPFNLDGTWTSRGLEGRTTAGYRQRRQARADAVAAVFLEQHRQYIAGFKDPKILAEVYREYSAVSQALARLMGKQDAVVA
mmetsp:Transcript_18328/g.45404  ORF Transcript_18328/g.45404 Transcript_18328/m.45404 type:complete len:170 (-) Transcript_18328:117-626(-)